MVKKQTLQIPLKEIQKAKKTLISKELFDGQYEFIKDKKYAFIPIKNKEKTKKIFKQYKIVEKELKKISKETDLRKILSKKLTKEELNLLKTAYDIIGTIAILEIDDVLKSKEKIIAETLLKTNKAIKTVLKKASAHEGEFRTQKMKWLAGEKTKEAIYKENNITLKLDVEKVYFSPRLSTERKRIMKQVKEGEDVLVMFSGCGPYPCTISKNTQARNVFGIEINPHGHRYAMENVKINRLHNVILINGDVKEIVPNIFHYIVGKVEHTPRKFDRIIMPLPKTADEFLPTALSASKKDTTIHFYDFLHEKEFDLAHKKIDKACKKAKLKYKILRTVKCGQHAPHIFRICVDFKIL